MTELADQQRIVAGFSRERWSRFADSLAAAAVVSLPWSTSATGILVALWFVALMPALDLSSLRYAGSTRAGGIPVLLWALALIGMLWSFGVPMGERLDGLKPFARLLAIPLLMAQFRSSGRGSSVLVGFLISCTVMLVLSWVLLVVPSGSLPFVGRSNTRGVVVKDYIAQATEFVTCCFFLAPIALKMGRDNRVSIAVVLSVLALAFVANAAFVATSRTALVIVPVLLLLFACRQLPWKGTLVLLLAGAVAAAALLSFDNPARRNVAATLHEVSTFQPGGESTRAGERMEFWRKSIGFVADAPWIGHGTGSIRDQFRRSVAGETGMAALASSNPHNQTFAIAIQLGLVGTAVLFAMWLSHVLMFRGGGMAAWAGLVVVTQNIVGSLFNSHLADFTQGWGYVFGVGVAAGMVLKQKADSAERAAPNGSARV